MFMGFDGWHALIILGMVLVPLAIVAAIVLVVVRVSRNQATPSPAASQNAPAHAPSASERLAELDRLREQGRVSDAEYEQTRARILGEL
ncbi:SHOCT domain-containing protein [Agromyces sp. NPDC060279]|uniref:SHOCT domain-containing protein n=1 Tax=Agromyces sp. NPDC060279 TaxID=3347092 RepID=UPI00364989E8